MRIKTTLLLLLTLLSLLIMNPAYASELVGRWVLESIENLSITRSLRVDAQFDRETISGFSSCNNYFGSYYTKNKVLTIESIQNTRKFCGGEAYKLETQYLNALKQAKNYEIVDDKLYIFNSENVKILSFEIMQS